MPGERILWSNSEIAIVVWESGSVNVYRVSEEHRKNQFNNNPANLIDICDAKRANELGLNVVVPGPIFKETPLFKVEELMAMAQKIANGKVFCLELRKKWQYSSCPLPPGVYFKMLASGDFFQLGANTTKELSFYVTYNLLEPTHYTLVEAISEKELLKEVPAEIITEAGELQRINTEKTERENKEYRRKKDEEDRERLMAKYGIKQ